MQPPILLLYSTLSYGMRPLANYMLKKRLKKGKEDFKRIQERRGKSDFSWRHHPVIWIHAASIGESLSALTLVEALEKSYPDFRFVITTGTTTSAKIMANKLSQSAIHQFFPLDYPLWVNRFLDNWNPQIALFIESEFWPNMLTSLKKRQIPCFLINGRISDNSFKTWKKIPFSIRYLLSTFTESFGQSELDTERLKILGAKNSAFLGNLKFVPSSQKISLSTLLEGKKRWLLSSSHKGEEEIAAHIHKQLKLKYPDIHTCIMPRHIERSDDIEAMLKSQNIPTTRYSRQEKPRAGGIYIFDAIGKAEQFYALGGPTLIGRSFCKGGGQNPIEPARFGNPILMGPDMSNFKHITQLMLNNNIAQQVQEESELLYSLETWLKDDEAYKKQAEHNQKWASQLGKGIIDAHLKQLTPYLEKVKNNESTPFLESP